MSKHGIVSAILGWRAHSVQGNLRQKLCSKACRIGSFVRWAVGLLSFPRGHIRRRQPVLRGSGRMKAESTRKSGLTPWQGAKRHAWARDLVARRGS
eukprot:13079265-Alexandrium_andersonii.AAC.1